MIYKTDAIRRVELKKVERFLDKLLSTFEQESEHNKWRDFTKDKYEGKYNFSYVKGDMFANGDFKRTSETTYAGSLSFNLDPELERLVLQNLPKLAPSITKTLANA